MQKNFVVLLVIFSIFGGLGLGYGLGSRMGWSKGGGQKMCSMSDGCSMMGDKSRSMPQHSSHAGMANAMQAMTGSLEGKSGAAFDEVFLREMIVHHEGAVAMAELALSSSARPEIVELSKAIISAQNQEIEAMKNWQKAWDLSQN